ncbi:MAG: peptidase M75 superfamily protein [Euryarchaeota archaeon]|nr:peptidase M75 superfamily protein [Euryarchaeota archaeon]|tara:strand:- start:1951 stop:3054 length:1104 start_codon:yes stop_codon:yes gene_type:complete
MKKYILTLFVLFNIVSSCDNTETELAGPTYDRSTLLNNWYNQHINIGLSGFKNKVEIVGETVDLFKNEKTIASLIKLREEHLKGWKAWQKIEMFNIGKAEEIYFRSKMNVYPVSTARVESNVSTGTYDLSNANNFAAQGFPALDYLLYGIGSTDEEILEKYTNDNKYLDYLKAITDEMLSSSEKVLNDWETYKNEFMNSTDNTATSAVNLMVNDFIYYYEKGFRANKFGIPGGVFSSVPLPENVEDYFGRLNSQTLALEAFDAIQAFFEGKNLETGVAYTGANLKSIVSDLDDKEGSNNLGNKISEKLKTAREKIAELDQNFVNQIQNDNNKFLQTYDAIQEVVVLLKVDMLQLLSINVDYVDADGD